MRKIILALGFLLAGSASAFGQTSAVTATITDPDSQTWNNGTYRISFVQPTGNSQPPVWNGTPMTAAQKLFTGTMSGSGVLTVSIPDSSFITPPGSSWLFVLCPDASASCSQVQTPVTGASPNLSSTLSAGVAAPRFAAVLNSYGYLDGEVSPTPVPGAQYFNVTSSKTRVWSGSAWADQGSGAGGSVSGSGTANTIAKWTSGSAIGNSGVTDNGTTVLTAENFVANGTASSSGLLSGSASGNNVQVTPTAVTLDALQPSSQLTIEASGAMQILDDLSTLLVQATAGTLTLNGSTGIVLGATTGRIAANGDFVNLGNTSTGTISGIAQGPTDANIIEVTPSASSVLAEETGAQVNVVANNAVTVQSLNSAITLTPASGQAINLGANANVTSAGALTVTGCTGCGGGLSGLTTNTIPKATSSTTIGNSSITDPGTTVATTENFTVGATQFLGWNTSSQMYAVNNGEITLTNAAANSFTGLNFGPRTSSFPSLRPTGTTLTLTLANGTAGGIFASPELQLNGSSSGNCTLIPDATATTITNNCDLLGPAGSATNATYAVGAANSGLYAPFAGQPTIVAGGTPSFRVLSSVVTIGSASGYAFTAGADAISGSTDTVISRVSAGVLAVGNGTSGNTTGNLQFGKVTKYNGTATTGDGLASILFAATQTAQVAAISDTTMVTVGGTSTLYRFVGEINCTGTSAAAQAALNLKWTDTGSQAQTLTVTDTCTALGSGSVADMVHAIRAKTGTTITYGVTITNTPTYDVDVRLEVM